MFKDYYIPQHKMMASSLRSIRKIVQNTQKKKDFDFSKKGLTRLVRTLKIIECKNRSNMKRMAKIVAELDALDTSELDYIPEYPPFWSISQYLTFSLSRVTKREWRPAYYD